MLEPADHGQLLHDALLRAFGGMVSIQLEYAERGRQAAAAYFKDKPRKQPTTQQHKKQEQEASDAASTTTATALVAALSLQEASAESNLKPVARAFVLCEISSDFRQRKTYTQHVSCAVLLI